MGGELVNSANDYIPNLMEEGSSLPDIGLPHSGPSRPSQPSIDTEITSTNKRRKVRSSPCWEWFELLDHPDGTPRAKCYKCGQEYKADPVKNGTSSLNHHMNFGCPHRLNKDTSQKIFQHIGGKVNMRDLKIDQIKVREMILSLVVKNELPLRFVEYEEFRQLMCYVYPNFTTNCRNTLLSDVHKAFNKEKKAIREVVKSSSVGRVSVTTDLWTSITNDGYMSLTTHYIDREWVLHKRLIKFCILTPPHSGQNICDAIRKILIAWGLEERLFLITIDNANANNVGVYHLIKSLNAINAFFCKGEFFHIRCCSHILNLIVQDGIKLIDKAVQKVRDIIKFVKISQSRKLKFTNCCENVNVDTKMGLHGDVSTRWNSTYQMLNDALYYEDAFRNLGEKDQNYNPSCPTEDDWGKIRRIMKLLKPFYCVTKVLSGSKYPTSNLYFLSVLEIQRILNDDFLLEGEGEFMQDMVHAMRVKFNKYWADYSIILSIVVVLDPRYKMEVVVWGFEDIYGENSTKAEVAINRVNSALSRLFGEYQSMPKEQGSSSSSSVLISDVNVKFLSHKSRKHDSINQKSELNQYYEEASKPLVTDEYDVLAYWKSVEGQYPDLSWMARDILAIPVSTVASESTFNVGGRVIDKYRSSLLPTNAEALICLRDWMFDVEFGVVPEVVNDGDELTEALGDVIAITNSPAAFTSTTAVAECESD